MQLSKKKKNQLIAVIQLFLCGIMAALAFRREITLGYKVNKKRTKKHNKKKRKGELR